MLKVPTIINYAPFMNKDFSFLVKEKVGKYKLYDFLADKHICIERKLPTETSPKKEDIDYFIEILESLNFKVKRVDELTIEYVDPECEEYEDVDLPLYKKTSEYETFSYLGTNYTLKNVPTKKTVEAAYTYLEKVRKTVEDEIAIINVKQGLENSFDNICFIYDSESDIAGILDKEKYLAVHILIAEKYKTLIIDKQAAKKHVKNDVLKLVVPSKLVGLVIGKKGENCKIISRKLGIKRINVVAG